MKLKTKNLDLVPHSPLHMLALIYGTEQYKQAFGIPAAEGLRDFFFSPDMSADYVVSLRAATTTDVWTHGFAIVHAVDRFVIGAASFKGTPDADNRVEIAYGVVPNYCGQGYATEAAQALTDFAFADERVQIVLAHTSPESNASTKVLAKCGYKFVGEVVDPVDGLIWRWEKCRSDNRKSQ